MRILILNWRDIKNPQKGGAEILTHEMAKRWVKWGHQVVQFSAWFAGAPKEEVIDGIKIVRQGTANIRSGRLPVHLAAFWWYQKEGKRRFDVVIDEIHGLPFFTPFYVCEKKVALICEVAQEVWNYVLPFPFNLIGRWQEKFYFKFYRRLPFLTISPSTKKDLVRFGIKEADIFVLPMGFSKPSQRLLVKKTKEPRVIFIGRLTRTKGVAEAIKAFWLIKRKKVTAKLWIVGEGDNDYKARLRKLVEKLGLKKAVVFWGFVSEKKKWELLSQSWVIVVPSVREGWGLIVPEAGLMKVPAVVYDVAGLRDVVKDKKTGLVCQENNPYCLAKGVITLLENKTLYERLAKNAKVTAEKRNWEKTAKASLAVLQKLC